MASAGAPSAVDDVRNEARIGVGDQAVGLADPQAGGFAVDQPCAQHRAYASVAAREFRGVRERLIDGSLVAVLAGLLEVLAAGDDLDGGALAAQERLGDVAL